MRTAWTSGAALAAVILAGCTDVVSTRPVDAGSAADVAASVDLGAPAPDVPAVADDVPVVEVDAGAAGDVGFDAPDDDAGSVAADAATAGDVAGPALDAGGRDLSQRGPFVVSTWMGAIPGTATQAKALFPLGTGARVPVVFFAHGFQLAVGNYDGLLSHLASWGYVVVSVDYPGSILAVDHRNVARALIAARTALASGVAGFPASGIIDINRSVVMGHSLGGKGSIMALLDEPAFLAGVTLDPVDDNPSPIGVVSEATPSIAPEQMGRLVRPLALFGATQSRCLNLGQSCAPEASNYLRFAAAAPMGARVGLYPLANFGHNDFVDTACGFQCSLCARGAAPLDSRAVALRFLTVAFLERFARGDETLDSYVAGEGRDSFVRSGALWDGRTASLPRCP